MYQYCPDVVETQIFPGRLPTPPPHAAITVPSSEQQIPNQSSSAGPISTQSWFCEYFLPPPFQDNQMVPGSASWHAASDRLLPLVMLPYLGGIENTVNEVQRSYKNGLRFGLEMLANPVGNHPSLKDKNTYKWNQGSSEIRQACQSKSKPMQCLIFRAYKSSPLHPKWNSQ